jgi:hypothetical protein
MACFGEIHDSHPQNFRQLFHIAIVSLIDLVHQATLNPDPSLYQRFRTVIVILHRCFLVFSKDPDWSAFSSTKFDDCGTLSTALTVNFTKALLLPGVTLHPGHSTWSADVVDRGQLDPLRIVITEHLLLWRVLRPNLQFIDFPGQFLTTSVLLSMLALHVDGPYLDVAISDRARLIEAGLLLMLWTSTYISTLDTSNINGWAPLTDALTDGRGHEEKNSFFVALACHYFFGLSEEILAETPCTVLDNLLIVGDWFSHHPIGKVCLYLLLKLCQMPACEPYFTKDAADILEFSERVHRASRGAVLIEVAVRIGQGLKSKKVSTVLAWISTMTIPKTKDVHSSVWAALFELLGEAFGDESLKQVVRVIDSVLSDGVRANAGLAAAVLRHPDAFQKIHARHAGFAPCTDILVWARAQTMRMRAIQETFTGAQVIEMLSNPEIEIEPYRGGGKEPAVRFDFKAYYLEINWLLAAHYMAKHCGITLPNKFVEDDPVEQARPAD